MINSLLQPSTQRLANVTPSTQLHLGKASELALRSTSAAPAGRVSDGARQGSTFTSTQACRQAGHGACL